MKRVEQGALFPVELAITAQPREKTSFALSAEAKFKLATLKANLRRSGHPATESAIMEALIQRAVIDEPLIGRVEELQLLRRNVRRPIRP